MTTPAGSAETNLPQTGPSGFDDRRPPERELLDDCVHCGFCLPTCPTYQLWGEEMDSPRGRIYLMDLVEKGEIGLSGPSRSTSTGAWAAWRASRRARPGCSTTGCWSRCARRSSATSNARRPTGSSATRSSRSSPTSAGCAPRPARSAVPADAQGAGHREARGEAAGPVRRDGVAAAAGVGAGGVRRSCPPTHLPSASAGRGWRCCRAACRTSSSTASTRPRSACSPRRAATCWCRAARAAAARWSCTRAGRTARSPGPGGRSPSTRGSTSTTWSPTPRAAVRR